MMRYREVAGCGAVVGLLAGWGEAVQLAVARGYPRILAPYKVSLDILWVAPLVDVLLFALGSVGLLVLIRRLPLRWRALECSLLIFALVFVTALTWATTLGILHFVAAALVSLGTALVVHRFVRPRQSQFVTFLGRRWAALAVVPLFMLPLTALAVRSLLIATETYPSAPAERGAPDVLVIVLDTVRADRFERPPNQSLTPRLDELAARGIRFRNAWSTTSWSLPSQASILTGRLPHEHGADWPDLRLNPKLPTLAECFANRSYATGCFSSNAAWIVPEHLGRGFQRFEVYQLEDLLRRTTWGRRIDRVLWEFALHYAGRGKPAATQNRQFLAWVDKYSEQPYFAYLCFMDVNRAFHAKRLNYGIFQRGPTPEVIAAYDNGLRELDQNLGELLDELERRGRLRNTLLIVTSDHGESFGAGAGHDHDPSGHGTSLYAEQLRVPLFVVPPDSLALEMPEGGREVRNVSIQDIPSTILHLLELSGPFVGTPLVRRAPAAGDISGTTDVASTLNYAGRELDSLVTDRWHLLRDHRPAKGQPARSLFDIEADRTETRNLAGDAAHEPVTREHEERLKQILAAPLRVPPSTAANSRATP